MKEDGVIDLELKDGVYVLNPEPKAKDKNVRPGRVSAKTKLRMEPAPGPFNDILDGIKLGVSIFRTVRKGFK